MRFNQDIRPLLSNNCYHCHGPDKENRQADMRLDLPGEVDLDEIVARITSSDPDLIMPPVDSHKKLKPEQIELLKHWISRGAPYEKHWAFVAPQAPEVPETRCLSWSNLPIDRFVLSALEKRGLTHSIQAQKRTLIRRVTLDLTGLPPTLAEIEAFLNDPSGEAYQKIVERLLASPHFGEHMARYWLDLVRFADTNGLHHDHYREMTLYRDWVIRSFNESLPFDDFITYQIAGDLFEVPSIDQKIASGFNRLHLIIDAGTALPEESFNRNVVDQVSAVGTAFLGLTVQCAVCHDHKYDPITQKDFYQLYAFFNNFDGSPETGRRGTLDFKRGLQPPYLELPSREQRKRLANLDSQIAQLEAQIKSLKTNQLQNTDCDRSCSESGNMEYQTSNLEKIQKQRKALIQTIPATLVMKERKKVRPAHILVRGAYDQLGEQVERQTPDFLPPLEKSGEVATRMDLANWLTTPDHPLTARVAVNRFWQQFFGVGLVKTSEDFGAQGLQPSHPDLLDHMSVRFVQSGWDVKQLVRTLVLSRTYQQSSHAHPHLYLKDPQNRLLARGSRYRLDAEVIRDQVLFITGLLNPRMFGKSVKPPQPEGLWEIVAMPASYPNSFLPDSGVDAYRRSVYTFWKRGLPPPQMTIFDAPTRESCIARRERTNTPLQALLMMNERQYFTAAMYYANNLLHKSELSDERRIKVAFEAITSQLPSEKATHQLLATLNTFRLLYDRGDDAALAMIAGSRDHDLESVSDPQERANLAAWTMIVHSILNLDTTKTHE